MTTWELASESELNELRLQIARVQRAGGTPPVSEDELKGLTKRRCGQLMTVLREMVKEDRGSL